MRKDCVLIATIPSLNTLRKVEQVFSNPTVAEVRFNTGAQTHYSPEEVITYLKKMAEKYGKKLWVDIKGRQLRITKWADPMYSCIELNHKIRVSGNAKIYFRNGGSSKIEHVENGNKLYVNPIPSEVLGAGQSVNIIDDKLEIEGYLTPLDIQYLEACKKHGVNNIMASYVECFEDLFQISQILPEATIISKIESKKGVEFARANMLKNTMVARDDLYTEVGQGYGMMKYLCSLITYNPDAICASRIFASLEKSNVPSFADFADLQLMYNMGYRKFMLCDNICNYRFSEAIHAWEDFVNA